ncbi:hypothetical protein B0H13DRAFT_2394864 [Mycena leptocephala]|nr:hypothetical protein B0H13DRAFT_2394864 [Mycena leptocephala]
MKGALLGSHSNTPIEILHTILLGARCDGAPPCNECRRRRPECTPRDGRNRRRSSSDSKELPIIQNTQTLVKIDSLQITIFDLRQRLEILESTLSRSTSSNSDNSLSGRCLGLGSVPHSWESDQDIPFSVDPLH